MIRLLLNYTFLLLIFFVTSCDNKSYQFKKSSEITDSLNQERFIIQKQFDRKAIKDTIQFIDKDSVIGTWHYSILLVKEDGSWYGMKPIDKKIKLTFYKSSKYKWKENNTFSKLDTIKYGQYMTANVNDSSYLKLLFNMNSDTIFNQGDTAFSESYLIDYLGKDTLWIRL